ncbi:MAG: prepilin-type N-terminal cleavage/methylation domain-containing protein [Candidatus Margulisbacteria bacterium]|nr:prepilin-type N-terminal cleavage/methylation domain-containing protein [Candidatus Margulisiibacteriota bacterium]
MVRNGYSLIELVVTMAIFSVLGLGIALSAPKIHVKMQAKLLSLEMLQLMYTGRSLSIATQSDTTFTLDHATFSLNNRHRALPNIEIPHPLSSKMKGKIGFTHKGHTKYSGSIFVSRSKALHKISIVVGHGRLTWI